jgi:glycosyltransferase involved in cell wall biosynthesis
MNRKPEVSVIFPAFNAENFIGQAIQSVLDQTFKNFELIIIDDGSVDNTAKIVSQFKDPRIILIRQERNCGPSTARNVGLELAKGEWAAFLDADDGWHKERLIKLLKVAKQHSNVFIGSDVLVCFSGRHNELIPWKTICRNRGFRAELIAFRTPFDFAKDGFDVKPICPLQIIRQFGLKFYEEARGPEWLEFILNLFRSGLHLLVLNEPLYYYRVTPSSLSSTYQGVLEELKLYAYLESFSWLDRQTQKIFQKNRKKIRYRLLTTALREKRWQGALHHIVQSPASVLYLLNRYPKYLLERRLAQRLAKKRLDLFQNSDLR